MSVLPIVRRELRVAARKRSTFWLRVVSAITAVLLGSGCLLMGGWQGAGTAQMGSILFYVLTWTCLAAALSAGLFFTSDCLSEEKREGTLGFLFLTDLRGYDVVLGKLLATSLRGFYALLAFLPILAVTQMMGGVTGARYWKSTLALVNALFCSLAAGMFISAISRDSQKALTGTLLVMLLLALGGPVVDGIIAVKIRRGFQPLFSLSSPGYVLISASAWGRSPYWAALLLTQFLSWAFFGLACALVPHTWQERKTRLATGRGWSYAWKYGGLKRRARLRRTLLERHPIAWLACRERWQMLGLWAMALLTVGSFVVVLSSRLPMAVWITWNYLGGLFTLVLYLWAASQSCRFLVEVRRSGFTELLLAAPVTEKQIIGGQWRCLLRMFGLPVLLLVSAGVAGTVLSQRSFQRIATQVSSVTVAGTTNQSGTVTTTMVTVSPNVGTNAMATQAIAPTSARQEFLMTLVAASAAALSTIGNLLALGWFGMWMGLISRTANLATLKAILFVQVIPWFVIAFCSSMVMMLFMAKSVFSGSSAQPTWWLVWWPLVTAVVSATLALIKDIGFIVWSRKKLYSSFRERAATGVGQTGFVAPPHLPLAIPAPPIIAAQP